jgi:hypothetical protein
MAICRFINPVFTFLDTDGSPLEGGLLYTYDTGTTDLRSTYTDLEGLTANSNPIVLDEAGSCEFYLTEGVKYKLVLKTSAGVTIQTIDPVVANFPISSTGDLEVVTEDDTPIVNNYVLENIELNYKDPNTIDFSPNGTGKFTFDSLGKIDFHQHYHLLDINLEIDSGYGISNKYNDDYPTVRFTPAAGAVNYIDISNNESWHSVTSNYYYKISAKGTDTNIDLKLSGTEGTLWYMLGQSSLFPTEDGTAGQYFTYNITTNTFVWAGP